MDVLAQKFTRMYEPSKNGCWLWTGRINNDGYGAIRAPGGRTSKVLRAHRVSYTLYKGDIPLSACVLHKCDNPACVNPDHLWLGSHTENMQDKVAKGRQSKKLNAEKVREIRDAGGRNEDIAKVYGVSRALVRQVKHRVIWRHVP